MKRVFITSCILVVFIQMYFLDAKSQGMPAPPPQAPPPPPPCVFNSTSPAIPCTTGACWWDTGSINCTNCTPSNPVLKVCNDTGTVFVEVQKNNHNLPAIFFGTVTNNGTVTNTSTSMIISDGSVINNGSTIFNGATTFSAMSPALTTLDNDLTVTLGKVLNFGGNTLTMIGIPVSLDDAATKDYVDTLAGGLAVGASTSLSFGGNILTMIGIPVLLDDAATKGYVDTAVVLNVSNDLKISPNEFTGLKLWLKADAITGLMDGDAIGTWNDSSTNGFNFSQSISGEQPKYETTEINGNPVVRFDGTDDSLESAGTLGSIIANNAYTIFVVYKSSDVSGGGILASQGNQNQGINYLRLKHLTNTFRHTGNDGSEISVDLTVTNGATTIVTARHDSGSIYSVENNKASTQVAAVLGNTANLTKTVVLGNDDNETFLSGDIAEIIVYNRVLDEASRVLIGAYLNKKYAVY